MQLTRRQIKNTVAAVVSLFFIGWFALLLRDADLDFFQPLLNLPLWLAVLVFLGLLLTYVLRGWRVAYEFREYPELSLAKSIQIVLWHSATVNFLPFRSGELAFPVLLQRIAHVPMMQALASLVHLRMQDATTVVLLGIVFWPGLDGAIRMLMVGATLAFFVAFYTWVKQPANWHGSPFFVKKYLASFRDAMATGNPSATLSWVLTVFNWIIKISIQAALYCYLTGIHFSTGVLATISSEVAAISPLQGVAGIGTFEVSSALALFADGVPWATGIQVAAQVHLIMLSSSLFWALMGLLIAKLTHTKTT